MDISVSKLEAAKQQLNTAIDLYFHDKDIISIHTLAAAANAVLRNIGNNQGEYFDFKKTIETSNINSELKKQFFTKFYEPTNFFKHADRDPNPEEKLTFAIELTEYILFEAAEMYVRITDTRSSLITAYRYWYVRNTINKPEEYALFSTQQQILLKAMKDKTSNKLNFYNAIMPILNTI